MKRITSTENENRNSKVCQGNLTVDVLPVVDSIHRNGSARLLAISRESLRKRQGLASVAC